MEASQFIYCQIITLNDDTPDLNSANDYTVLLANNCLLPVNLQIANVVVEPSTYTIHCIISAYSVYFFGILNYTATSRALSLYKHGHYKLRSNETNQAL